MAPEDYVMTIDSDDEVVSKPSKKKTSKKDTVEDDVPGPQEKDALNPDFTFDLTGDVYADVLGADIKLGDLVKGSKRVRGSMILLRRMLNKYSTPSKGTGVCR
jgi:ATP-dependent RNA helicase DDX27